MNKIIMGPALFLSVLLLTSCSGKQSSFTMGHTTRADVVAEKGEPLSEEILPVHDGKIMKYSDDEKIQLKGEIVTNRFTNPRGNEKLVMWWKHKFKDCLTNTQKIASDPNSHTPPEIEFSCPEEGLSVIYTEGSVLISRVVENEKK